MNLKFKFSEFQVNTSSIHLLFYSVSKTEIYVIHTRKKKKQMNKKKIV